MDKELIGAVIAAVIGSNALWGFIQFLLERKDKKEDCSKKIVEMIKELDEKLDEKINELNDKSIEGRDKLDKKFDEKIEELNNNSTQRNEKLNNKIDKLDNALAERSIIACRVRILKFMDEILEGWEHSKDSYNQVIQDITNYERYCAEHPLFKNHQTVATIAHIKADYQERLEKNDFRTNN
jgi:hypothetical protein